MRRLAEPPSSSFPETTSSAALPDGRLSSAFSFATPSSAAGVYTAEVPYLSRRNPSTVRGASWMT